MLGDNSFDPKTKCHIERPTAAIIDLGAIPHNIPEIRKKPETDGI